ncbi:peptidase E [Aquabacterium humicola]|uniref:Type 1 glutamine amidotransferase-like domain-containing protein n=1 Tax=Aquabacterium humicola TaxID=3237377 RepID=UPI0025438D0A|nr:peptidase E [Rubrivivax pictus]
MSGSIVAIGGGGFLMDDTTGRQERYLLSLLRERRQRPRVLYVGTAAGDSERMQLRFMNHFVQLGCEPATLPFFQYDMKRDYHQAVRDADLVYVGGGNTPAMLAVWREFGFDATLREVWQAGTVLAGISAGANCWFEQYITDSVPGGGVRAGLGFLPGTFCPHLDSEAWRQPVLAEVRALPAFGAPDGVMLHFDGTRFAEAVTSLEGREAVRRTDAAKPVPLPTRLLAAS